MSKNLQFDLFQENSGTKVLYSEVGTLGKKGELRFTVYRAQRGRTSIDNRLGIERRSLLFILRNNRE